MAKTKTNIITILLAFIVFVMTINNVNAGQGCPFDNGSCQEYCSTQGCHVGYCGHFAWIQCICRKCGEEWTHYVNTHGGTTNRSGGNQQQQQQQQQQHNSTLHQLESIIQKNGTINEAKEMKDANDKAEKIIFDFIQNVQKNNDDENKNSINDNNNNNDQQQQQRQGRILLVDDETDNNDQQKSTSTESGTKSLVDSNSNDNLNGAGISRKFIIADNDNQDAMIIKTVSPLKSSANKMDELTRVSSSNNDDDDDDPNVDIVNDIIVRLKPTTLSKQSRQDRSIYRLPIAPLSPVAESSELDHDEDHELNAAAADDDEEDNRLNSDMSNGVIEKESFASKLLSSSKLR